LNRQRFEQMAQAYGGDIARWPAGLREEAALLAAAEPDFAHDVLAGEAQLDAALEELPRVVASSRLFESIVAKAPPLKPRRFGRFWLGSAGLGAALAATAVAGVMLGAQLGLDDARRAEASAQSVADLDISAVQEVG
jgi:hypothetical protein